MQRFSTLKHHPAGQWRLAILSHVPVFGGADIVPVWACQGHLAEDLVHVCLGLRNGGWVELGDVDGEVALHRGGGGGFGWVVGSWVRLMGQ